MDHDIYAVTRREALRRVAFLLGGAVSAHTVLGVLAGCDRGERNTAAAWRPRALTAEQNEMVAAISEHILPETDTPGAKAARVNEFVDAMLADYYPAAERERFFGGLTRLDARARQLHRQRFLDCTPEQQVEMVAHLDRLAFARADEVRRDPAAAQREPATQQGDVATGRSTAQDPGAVSASGAVAADGAPDVEDTGTGSFFRTMKELTLVGYYTSEVGATRELRVNPMGTWRADIPYSEVGRAWA